MVEFREDEGKVEVPNALTLNTFLKPRDRSVRLVNIQWWQDDPDGRRVVIRKIKDREEMTIEAAREFSHTFAQENDIPVIYECHQDDE